LATVRAVKVSGLMIRALFFGLGTFVALWGMTLVAVDGVVLSFGSGDSDARLVKTLTTALPDGRRVLSPPDWIGFTLVGMGGLTMLYSVALPRG